MSGDLVDTVTSEINIVEIVQNTINELCSSLFSSIQQKIFPLLDEIIFIDNDIMETTQMEKIFADSPTSGILLLANCLLTAFVLYYCLRLALAHFSSSKVEHPGKFFIKTILAGILMNYTPYICTLFINLTADITSFFSFLAQDLFDKEISFVVFTSELNSFLSESFNMFSLDGILSSTLSISSFSLVLNFSLRYIFLKLLIILSPFCTLCLINNNTTSIFKSWIKCFFSLLLLQIVVSIILIISFAVMKDSTNSYFNKLLLIRYDYCSFKIKSICERVSWRSAE